MATTAAQPLVEAPTVPVNATGESDPAGGTLPETGSDALPLALAGAGLVAVGGGLLLGRRMRRARP